MVRACQLEDAVKLMQATKLRLVHEHSQIEDAYTKSKEICSRLSDVENSLSQTKAAVTSYLNGEVDMTKDSGQLAHVQQPEQVSSKAVLLEGNKQDYWNLWLEFSQLLSSEMAEMQSSCPDKDLLQEAVVLFAKHCDNQKPSGVLKEENLLDPNVLPEQVMKNAVDWLVKARDIQELQQIFSQKTQDNLLTDLICLENAISKREEINASTDSEIIDAGGVTLGFWLHMFFLLAHSHGCNPNQGTSSVLAWSDICAQGLKDSIPGLSKPFSSLFLLLAAVGLTTILKTEFAGSQAGSSCNKYRALPPQQQEQQRRDMIQHDDHEIKLLKYESSSQSPSLSQGLCSSKRKSSNSHGEDGIDLVQLSAKKVHTCKDAKDPMLQSQMQNYPFLGLVAKHQTTNNKNGMVTREGQNDEESLSSLLPIEEDISMRVESKNTIDHHSSLLAVEHKTDVNSHSNLATVEGNKGLNSYSSTLLLTNEGKGSPNQSAKDQLWQVLELGPDISCNDTIPCYKNGKSTALDLSLATSRGIKQYSSEPLLVLRDDGRWLHRPIVRNRASPRLLARRLADK